MFQIHIRQQAIDRSLRNLGHDSAFDHFIGNFLPTPMANGPPTGFGVLAGYGNYLGELFGAELRWGARARGIL